jgi:hypothetical protein
MLTREACPREFQGRNAQSNKGYIMLYNGPKPQSQLFTSGATADLAYYVFILCMFVCNVCMYVCMSVCLYVCNVCEICNVCNVT